MGFGLLFLGFFFLLRLSLGGFDATPDIIGALILYAGVSTLIKYCPTNKAFAYARTALLPTAVLSLVELGFQIAGALGGLSESVDRNVRTPVSLALAAAIGVFTALLLLGINRLALEVELPKLASRAGGAVAVTAVYYVLQFVGTLGGFKALSSLAAEPQVLLSLMNSALLILSLVWFFSVWALIFSCYMHICLEGDEDMPYHDNMYDRTLSLFVKKKKKPDCSDNGGSVSKKKKKGRK